MSILQVEKIVKSFGGLMALCEVNFEVHPGEIFCVIGPNGSGKSTLFNVVTGFLKATSGKVTFMGKDITGLVPHQICRKGIARIFQLVKPFYQLTTFQNVMVGRAYGKEPANNMRSAKDEVVELLNFVGLGNKIEVIASQLTMAERKKLELARALAAHPQLLLLDELMAGLNSAETETAMDLVNKIRDSGVTVMMVEHIMKAVLGISDRIIVLNAGEKIAEGFPKEVVKNQLVIEAYLGK
ncbi:MAG TPA: ABC transporter ATP-binding protein [Thermodesulfobacteriota bacterium]|jgi:branched-chain amino acid transport system ATP-binding protein|nr:ABC transporter ATP-binding protein [Thermodesulfobacteriota bacterium]